MPEKEKFAHIERCLQLGLIHLEKPRVIYWYGTGFNDHHLEWIDHPGISQAAKILMDFEMKDLELQREGTKDFPYLKYYEYMERIGVSPF